MAFFYTNSQSTRFSVSIASLIKRTLERMVEGQELTAVNMVNAHLKRLPDFVLEDFGYSDDEIKKIREVKESSCIL